MRLIHFAQSSVIELNYSEQAPVDSDYVQQWGSLAKPMGLWVSDEEDPSDAWSGYCRQNGRPDLLGPVSHEVVLANDARIRHIENGRDLDLFTGEFRVRTNEIWTDVLGPRIDWPWVAETYQGILITPFVHSRTNDRWTYWYKLWDCASGCIWDPAAVASISVVELTKEAL